MAADDIANIPENLSTINLYRAKIATPEDFEQLRFFVQQELKAIETGFSSVDEVIRAISVGTGGGEPGIDGQDGAPGTPGRGIQVYKQSGDPKAQGAQPGDVWFVIGFD